MSKRYNVYAAHDDFNELDNQQKQIIFGGLMGDGSIVPTYYNSPKPIEEQRFFYRETHGLPEQDYVQWKREYGFSDHETRDVYRKPSARSPNPLSGFRTGPAPFLTQMYIDIYRPSVNNIMKKRIFDIKYLEQLDWLGFLVFYLDDGSLTRNAGLMRIGMASFNPEAAQFLKDWIANRTPYEIRYGEYLARCSFTGREFMTRDMTFPNKLRDYVIPIFSELFDEYNIPDCMRRKIEL